MNQSTPLTVAVGTIASSVTGALITGTYALAKRKGQVVASIYAASAAVNCGTAGAIFFSIRGYVIVPLLIQTLPSRLYERKNDLGNGSVSSEGSVNGAMASWGTMRLHRTLDSALSGGITGSVLNTWKRGTRGAFPGLMFGSVFCALGQLLYNEFGVQRLKFISRRYSVSQHPVQTAPEPVEPPIPKQPLLDRMVHAVGFNKLSDEEYLVQMKEKRATYLRRIARLEAQLEEEKNSKHP